MLAQLVLFGETSWLTCCSGSGWLEWKPRITNNVSNCWCLKYNIDIAIFILPSSLYRLLPFTFCHCFPLLSWISHARILWSLSFFYFFYCHFLFFIYHLYLEDSLISAALSSAECPLGSMCLWPPMSKFHFSFDSLTQSSLWLWLGHNYGTCKSTVAIIALAELASWVHSTSSLPALPLPLPQFFLRCPCGGLCASSLFSLW